MKPKDGAEKSKLELESGCPDSPIHEGYIKIKEIPSKIKLKGLKRLSKKKLYHFLGLDCFISFFPKRVWLVREES